MVTSFLFILIMWLSTFGIENSDPLSNEMSEKEEVFSLAGGFDEVHEIVNVRCSMCHAREPVYNGIHYAPKQVYLETPKDVVSQSSAIFLHSGITHAMPPGNITEMEQSERDKIKEWYRSAVSAQPLWGRLY